MHTASACQSMYFISLLLSLNIWCSNLQSRRWPINNLALTLPSKIPSLDAPSLNSSVLSIVAPRSISWLLCSAGKFSLGLKKKKKSEQIKQCHLLKVRETTGVIMRHTKNRNIGAFIEFQESHAHYFLSPFVHIHFCFSLQMRRRWEPDCACWMGTPICAACSWKTSSRSPHYCFSDANPSSGH